MTWRINANGENRSNMTADSGARLFLAKHVSDWGGRTTVYTPPSRISAQCSSIGLSGQLFGVYKFNRGVVHELGAAHASACSAEADASERASVHTNKHSTELRPNISAILGNFPVVDEMCAHLMSFSVWRKMVYFCIQASETCCSRMCMTAVRQFIFLVSIVSHYIKDSLRLRRYINQYGQKLILLYFISGDCPVTSTSKSICQSSSPHVLRSSGDVPTRPRGCYSRLPSTTTSREVPDALSCFCNASMWQKACGSDNCNSGSRSINALLCIYESTDS